MFSRGSARALRSLHPSSSSSTSIRPFTASAPSCNSSRAPALADITPDGTSAFDEKQKQFREQLASNQRRREQEESQSSSRLSASKGAAAGGHGAGAGTAAAAGGEASFPPIPKTTTSQIVQGIDKSLSSLSFSNTEEARARETSAQDGGKKSGPLSSLFYGTPEGRQLDKDIERSFSQVLARGKYVHTIVFHEVYPDKVDEYVDLVGTWYPKIAKMPENKVNLVGSWRTEVGDCDTFVHIWEYQRYTGYHGSQHHIHHLPEYSGYEKKLKTLIKSKRTSLMQEFSFWPTTPPRQLGGLFELRSYTLHPGNLLEWETHWRRGLNARREVMEGVGAWFVQIGDLNTVHHLWQFANLEERKQRREQSWSIEGWGETVHKTVPLIQTMRSRILIPMPWSPVA